MKPFMFLFFVSVALISGCGVTVTAAPQPNALQRRPPQAFAPHRTTTSPVAYTPRPSTDINCMGVPDDRCRTYRNMLGPGKAITVLRVDNRPIRILPYGGILPLPRLLNGQVTALPFAGCSRRDEFGNCVFVIWAEAYDVRTMSPNTDAPAAKEMMTRPVIDPAYRTCYSTAVTIQDSWNGLPISHHWSFDKVPCGNDIYPVTAKK